MDLPESTKPAKRTRDEANDIKDDKMHPSKELPLAATDSESAIARSDDKKALDIDVEPPSKKRKVDSPVKEETKDVDSTPRPPTDPNPTPRSPASEHSPLPTIPQAPQHETQYIRRPIDSQDNGQEEGELEEGELEGDDANGVESKAGPAESVARRSLKPKGSPGHNGPMSAPSSPYVPLRSPMEDRVKPRMESMTLKFTGCSPISEYEEKAKVGEGTFGIVKIAYHKHTGDKCALKQILMHNEKEGMPITALREIKLLKKLRHPNIVTLKEMAYSEGNRQAKQQGRLYMVFEYMDHDLTGLLDNPQVTFKPEHVKCYMKQLLEGTSYLHKNGILHRDMKSANILVDNKGHLKLADFGLARSWDKDAPNVRLTPTVVTRWYRPPELFMLTDKYTETIDMWGVGCVFGEILKRRPILAAEESEQLEKIFELMGTPNDTNWPGWRDYPLFSGPAAPSYAPRPSSLHMKFPSHHYDPQTVSLLEALLRLDPKQRISAEAALKHDYFLTEPEAAIPGTSA
ncbi:serine/threonine protein kinase, CMGC, CDC2/CDK sub [Rhizophlyctis rosea]|nr:serine/threonine protein kinase, CMGC, CDC2/CDK sub [Rhizophlyctis rosea]